MHLVCNANITLRWNYMLPLHRRFNRFRNAKPRCPNPRLYRCAKIRIRHPYMKWWIDVKWCVIHLCFGRDQLKDEVKQLLILPIVVFCFWSAYILRLSNRNLYVFGCSGPGYYFRFVGRLVQYIIIVVDLFHNGICTCVLFSSRVKSVWHLKIIHVDASILV